MTARLLAPSLLATIAVSPAGAQDAGSPRPAAGIGIPEALEVILAWYAHNDVPPYLPNTTLVLSPTSDGQVPGPGWSLRRTKPQAFSLPAGWVDEVEGVLGVPVRICADYDRDRGLDGLCGIAFPWLWLFPSIPVEVEGRVQVKVREHTLTQGPTGEIVVETSERVFTLEPNRGEWMAVLQRNYP
jgi:hypothetical protein